MRLSSSMKAAVSAKFAEAGRVSMHRRSWRRTMRRERPVTSATRSVPKRCRIWSSAPCTGGKRGEMLDHPVAPFDRFARDERIAVGIVSRARVEIALVVGVEFEQLCRKRVAQIIEHVFPRRDVDREVGPFRGRDRGEPAVEQGLVGRDDLQNGGMAGLEIARKLGDQGRAFHRRQQMVEETLLVGFESRACRSLGVAVVGAAVRSGDVGGL